MNSPDFFAAPTAGIAHCMQDAAFVAFNRLPSRYLHRSWRSEFAAADLSDFLFDTALSHRLLSDHICLESGLEDIDFDDSGHPAVRIGMQLDDIQLLTLCRRIGLALIGQPVRRAIAGKEIASWIAALGEPLFRFACRYAPLLDGASLATLSGGSAPLHPDTVAERAATVGQQLLSAASFLTGKPIGQRLRFKLPRQISHQTDLTINPTRYSEVWTWIDRIWNCMPMHVSPSPMQTQAGSR